jgi:hypothetical protein
MSEFEAEKATTGKTPCDCGCGDCGGAAKPQTVDAQPDNNRRKLLFGGVLATPAVVMLSSRSALAGGGGGGQCTASAHASVNLSKPKATGCKSLSPGCWKNTLNWPSPFKPGLPAPPSDWSKQFTVSDDALKNYLKNTAKCSTKSSTLSAMVAKFRALNTQATMCSHFFSIPSSGKSFMQALHDGGGGDRALLRMAVACVLNAAQFGPQAFGYTYLEIAYLINTRYSKGDSTLHADLSYLTSDRGGSCPSGGSVNSINWCSVLS